MLVQINVLTGFPPIWCSSQNFVNFLGYSGVYVTAIMCPTHSQLSYSISRKGKRLRIKNIFHQMHNLRVKIPYAVSVSPCPNYPNLVQRTPMATKTSRTKNSITFALKNLEAFSVPRVLQFRPFQNRGRKIPCYVSFSLHTARRRLQPQVILLYIATWPLSSCCKTARDGLQHSYHTTDKIILCTSSSLWTVKKAVSIHTV